ncbi:MAG: DUF6335 family protein [Candidatus Binatia bacterium]
MAKIAKKRAPRSKSTGRQTPRRTTSTRQPISTAGLDTIGENEPGAPDGLDVAETARPMSPHAAKSLDLAGGDLDASFPGLDSGEEAVGGSDPLPDQNDVDRIGHALGVEEQDEKPLATTEKIESRDRDRWELDPASAEDFGERVADAPRRRRRTTR